MKSGADPNIVRIKDRFSPLHIAAKNGYINIVKLLLKSKANPDLRESNNNLTAKMLALKNKFIDIAEILQVAEDNLGGV